MAEIIPVDAIILGAGIAGFSCADAFQLKARTCVVIDTYQPGKGTSGSPGMLVNPATGRRARKAWRAKECFELISDLLERVQDETDQSFFEKKGVVRPALTKELAVNFERSPGKYNWTADWVEWLSKEKFSERFPIFGHHFGGLFVKKAMTVNGSIFMKAFAEYLAKHDVMTEFESVYQLLHEQGKWFADLNSGIRYKSDVVIDATGYNQVHSNNWESLNLHPVKGQTATFYYDERLPLNMSISSLGYMAFLTDQPKQVTVGSTYEHKFDNLETDEEGLQFLKKKLDRTLPGWVEKSSSVKQWSGVRVTVTDRKPVIGIHPEKDGLHIIGALGSKGLLMGRLMAEMLVESILDEIAIDDLVTALRLES